MTTGILDRKDIDSRIKTLISEKLGINESVVVEGSSFSDDLNVDSLDLYELLMEVEKEFLTNIPDEDAERLTTVDSLINYVQNRIRS
jgi:acyl carrier protein